MSSRLIDLLPQLAKETDASNSSEGRPRLRPQLIPGVLQACSTFGMLTIAIRPELLSSAIPQGFTLFAFIASICIGALLLVVSHHFRQALHNAISLIAVVLGQALAAVLLLAGTIGSETAEPSLLAALALSGLSLPFVLACWCRAFASFPRGDIFASSATGFVLFVLFFAFSKANPHLTPSATMACAFFSSLSSFANRTLLFEQRGSASSTHDKTASKESSEGYVGLSSLLFSIPFLGLLICVLTAGFVAHDPLSREYVLSSPIAALIVVLATVSLFFAQYRKRTINQLFFLIFDIGLPGCAVIAFLVKMIPIELVSIAFFPHFMEAYFLLLTISFWVQLVLFEKSNSRLLVSACCATTLSASAALALGFLIGFLGDETKSVVLGLATAIFLILAVVAVGYSIILYVKGSETEDELAPTATPPDLGDVCRILAQEHQLTPREGEVLAELAYGHSSSYIAKVLFISSNTARSHMKNIYKKLNVRSREELIELLREKQGPRRDGSSGLDT